MSGRVRFLAPKLLACAIGQYNVKLNLCREGACEAAFLGLLVLLIVAVNLVGGYVLAAKVLRPALPSIPWLLTGVLLVFCFGVMAV